MITLSSCAGTMSNRNASKKLAQDIREKKYDIAIKDAKSKSFYAQENSVLLRKLEIGTIHYLKGDYFQALKYFEDSKKISDDLYTTSIKKAIAGGWDANLDDYFGERYERSMIRYYLSLINYNIFKQGFYEEYKDGDGKIVPQKTLTESEKRFHLSYARSSIIEWDSLLQSMQNESMGIPIYKNDMIAKLWGAFIHTEMDSPNDRQIALQLYRDANDLLLRNYNVYPVFNNKSDKFNKDFKDLPNISYQKLQKEYVDETQYSKDLQEFINRNKKNLERRRPDNLVIMVKDDLISPKVAKPIEIPFPITSFGPQGSDLYELARLLMTTKQGMPFIVIEFPEIAKKSEINKISAIVYNENGDQVAKTNLSVIQPLSDIAKKTLDDKIAFIRTAIISRITAKYVAAISSSYAVYSQDSTIAKISAMAMFATSSKVINETSRADIRYWVSLFSDLHMGGFRLASGDYKVEIFSNDKKIEEKMIHIRNGETSFLDLNF